MRVVNTVASVRASRIASATVRTLCPTSSPMSNRSWRSIRATAATFVSADTAEWVWRSIRSMSEKGA